MCVEVIAFLGSRFNAAHRAILDLRQLMPVHTGEQNIVRIGSSSAAIDGSLEIFSTVACNIE